MNVTDTLSNPAAQDHLPLPAPGLAPEQTSHSADSLALFWIMVGLGGIFLAGLVNLLTGFLSR